MTKPFNLADAKLGHPVQTVSGNVATIFKFDYQMSGTTHLTIILGSIAKTADNWFVTYWEQDGSWFSGGPLFNASALNLVMAPLGQVDGRDVYPGDMLCFNGEVATSPVPYGVPFRADEWKWPHSYPVTRMSETEMRRKLPLFETSEPRASHLVIIANEAIKHGIDNGYLFDAREFDSFTQSDGSPSTPADIVQAMRSLMKSNDALQGQLAERNKALGEIHKLVSPEFRWTLEGVVKDVQHIVDSRKESIANTKQRERTIARAAMSNGWHAAYDKGGLRIDCPRVTDEKLDAFISTVKV